MAETSLPNAAAPSTRRLKGILLDARRDRLDLRDRLYLPPLASLPPQYPSDQVLKEYLASYIKADLVLDQGSEGACTGFGLACVINYLHWTDENRRAGFEPVSPRMLYHLARIYDEWPGEDYEGSSCRGALKGWHKHGVCTDNLWPYRKGKKIAFVDPKPGWAEDAVRRPLGVYYRVDAASIVEMQAAINEIGAVFASAGVHDGWSLDKTAGKPTFANLPLIHYQPGSHPSGGHAFALVGFNEQGFVIQNSWGQDWGLRGFAILTYEDWLANGDDCWATALGVPSRPAGHDYAVRLAFAKTQTSLAAPRSLAMLLERAGEAAPDRYNLSQDEAYYRTVVLGNEGRPDLKIVEHRDAASSVVRLGSEIPRHWLDSAGSDNLVVFAHGGLNTESDSIRRIRRLGKLFQDNGIYPLFVTWRTGPVETITNIVEDEFSKFLAPFGGVGELLERLKDRAIEEKDRLLEVIARNLIVKAMWQQMKQNAHAASEPGGGGRLLAEGLRRLATERPSTRIHLVGHSAGAIILGHMLEHLPQLASCTLLAPACTVEFANEVYAPAVERGPLAGVPLRIHVLDDARELEDSVGPYGKSLLYLVSRALEPVHKTPLLGLEAAFRADWNNTDKWNQERHLSAGVQRTLETWQSFWASQPAGNRIVESNASIRTGSAATAKPAVANHGCFDNHAGVIDSLIETVLGRKPPLPAPDLDFE